jgi:hypothetical protein
MCIQPVDANSIFQVDLDPDAVDSDLQLAFVALPVPAQASGIKSMHSSNSFVSLDAPLSPEQRLRAQLKEMRTLMHQCACLVVPARLSPLFPTVAQRVCFLLSL